MPDTAVIYTIIHQPRRLKLPAQPIPEGASCDDIERCLFDEPMNRRYIEKVSRTCYRPATEKFAKMLDEGLSLSLGISQSFWRQAETWVPDVAAGLRQLASHPRVEVVAVDPVHSFLLLFDLPAFIEGMRSARQWAEDKLGRSPRVADTTEMFMSTEVYYALERAGYSAGLMDGREWAMGWRDPTYLYTHRGGPLKLFARHYQLSDDVGYRFSNRSWEGYPLRAGDYAHWLKEARGDFAFIGWDFETFGEHHREESGIFQFMDWLPGELAWRNVDCVTVGQALDKFAGRSFDLSLPEFGSTWAGSGGIEFFLGNSAQQAIFRLMGTAYQKAKLTGDPGLMELAVWLLQSDNLHLIQWQGRTGDEAEVSAYFMPDEWWSLGPDRVLWEQQEVYKNFIRALDHHLLKESTPGWEDKALAEAARVPVGIVD